MPIEMDDLPIPKPLVGSNNLRFYPNTLTSVSIYVDNVFYGNFTVSSEGDYCTFSSKPYMTSESNNYSFTSLGYDFFSVTKAELTASTSENPILAVLHPAVAIPNITVNNSDYWETHKSEYNALIGNPVGTFKLDLSSYNTTANTLYAWTTTGYYDINDTTKPLTVYTLSETPAVNDKTYDSNGDEFDGRCWTGAEQGTVPNNINGVTNTTITLGIGKPTPTL